jgi:hypothetical protein
MPIERGRLKQEDWEFKATLDYIAGLCLKNISRTKTRNIFIPNDKSKTYLLHQTNGKQ